MNEESIAKLHSELKEVKEDSRSRIDFFEGKLRAVESERAEANAKEQGLRESMAQLSKEKERLETEMTERIETLRKDSMRQLEEQRTKMAAQEEQTKELLRARMSSESEFDKQKALLEQKTEFLER